MENPNYINRDIGEKVWNGEVGELYHLLYCERLNWQFFIETIEEKIGIQNERPQMRILDCACGGCGEPAISLALKGYKVWATDGFIKMLDKAKKFAEEREAHISFSSMPIKFWELKDYYQDNFFDIIFCAANSASHIPPEKIDITLRGMASLIRKGGKIVLDTKHYTENGKELIADKKTGKAIKRVPEEIPLNNETMYFGTSFSYPDGEKSLKVIYHIKITRNDGSLAEYSLPFWRYTAEHLKSYLEVIGLDAGILSPEISKWKYEIAIGVK